MTIHQCDICQTKIEKTTESVYVSDRGIMHGKTLCLECGKPVLEFMEQNGLRETPGINS